MNTRILSLASALALTALIPATSAHATFLGGGLNIDLGIVDVTVGGPNGVVDGNVNVPGLPGGGGALPSLPGLPGLPTDPGAAGLPGVPGLPVDVGAIGLPGVPSVPGLPGDPGAIGLPVDPGSIGIGTPGGVDVNVDVGIAAVGLSPGANGAPGVDFTILPSGRIEPGAQVGVSVLNNNANVAVNRGNNLVAVQIDRDGDGLIDIVIPKDLGGLLPQLPGVPGVPGLPQVPGAPTAPVANAQPSDSGRGVDGRSGNPNNPAGPPNYLAQVHTGRTAFNDLSGSQRRAVRQQCRSVLASPQSYDRSLVTLCAALR